MKSRNTNIPLSFINCAESIKEEDIKEEVKDKESVDDPLPIHYEIANSNECPYIRKEINEEDNVDDPLSIEWCKRRSETYNICTEVKGERINDDTLCVQEIHNSRDEENNTDVDDIDIVEHKIEIDDWSCIKSSVYIWVYLNLKQPTTKKGTPKPLLNSYIFCTKLRFCLLFENVYCKIHNILNTFFSLKYSQMVFIYNIQKAF